MKTNQANAFSMDAPLKGIEDMVSAGKESSDAFMKCGTIFAEGMQELMQTCFSHAKTSGEKNADIWKSLSACKSINEFAEVQNRIAQGAFEEMMAVTAEMSEMSIKTMMEAFEPLNKQMAQSMKKAAA
jgi:phasin family protein